MAAPSQVGVVMPCRANRDFAFERLLGLAGRRAAAQPAYGGFSLVGLFLQDTSTGVSVAMISVSHCVPSAVLPLPGDVGGEEDPSSFCSVWWA